LEDELKSFRDLIAWQKAMTLAEGVYAVTAEFPREERFGLISQMRRCAVSVASNIAEGHGRLTKKEWQHFLAQARGSAYELQTQVDLATRLAFAGPSSLSGLQNSAEEVGRIINGLLASTRSISARKPTDESPDDVATNRGARTKT
jgi:four helix bundle protein